MGYAHKTQLHTQVYYTTGTLPIYTCTVHDIVQSTVNSLNYVVDSDEFVKLRS